MRPTALRALLLTTAVFTLLATLAAPAQAEHSGDANSGTPDNADHYIDRNSLTSAATTATTHGINQLNRTDMNATLTGSGDVEVFDAYYGTTGDWSGTAGRVSCNDSDWWWTGDCDVFYLRYNLSYAASYSTNKWRSLACHEFGHTGGLGHRSSSSDSNGDSCMQSTVSANRPNFDFHDVNAINAVV